MDAEAVKGLLELSTERELITIVLAAAVSGVLTFALAWKILSTSRDVQLRQLDSIDTAMARIGEEQLVERTEEEGES